VCVWVGGHLQTGVVMERTKHDDLVQDLNQLCPPTRAACMVMDGGGCHHLLVDASDGNKSGNSPWCHEASSGCAKPQGCNSGRNLGYDPQPIAPFSWWCAQVLCNHWLPSVRAYLCTYRQLSKVQPVGSQGSFQYVFHPTV